MKYTIRKVAVLGSGIMGSGIAALLAGAGFQVRLLDLPARDEKAPRNSMADVALKDALKSKPEAFYTTSHLDRIETGNFEDDFEKIDDCEWIIEVVVERLDIKKSIFEKVDKFRKKGSLVSSNTSGIPIHLMTKGRSDDFKKHFCGTHFFNPPRYLRLLEVIPTPDTDPAVIDFFMHFVDRFLGKQTVLCKDTPAFIANRVGVYAMAKIFHLSQELELPISVVDKLTGPAIGRPRTGTFRLGDLVGLDTAAHVLNGLKENCPDDEQNEVFEIPNFVQHLLKDNNLGNKTGQGFYKKTDERDESGRAVIHELNLKTSKYEKPSNFKLNSLDQSKQIDNLNKRLQFWYHKADDAGGQLIKQSLLGLFAYVSNRIPEISDNIYSIDHALKAGFNWQLGPFEYWDSIGVKTALDDARAAGEKVADWVDEMLEAGHETFYRIQQGVPQVYSPAEKAYVNIPGAKEFIILDHYRHKEAVYKNNEMVLHDIGDGVLCLEFTSKSNAIGEGILTGINKSIEIAEEQKWKGIVIGNNATNFTVGANIMMIGMMAFQQEWDELNMAVKLFQQTMMRCRYSSIPVVAATQGFVFGGGCEMSMHCDKVVAAAESYIGLVEAGVGLIPGGGGTKEFALRAGDSYQPDETHIPILIERFKTIAMATVSTSAFKAFDDGYLIKGRDEVVMNSHRNIAEAKKAVLTLSENYVQPIERTDIKVLGRTGLGALYIAAHSLQLGGFASEHDIKIAKKMAFVLCGGDLSAGQEVSEKYLLDIEREAFLSLCGEAKTMERIQHMLQTNKPLRN